MVLRCKGEMRCVCVVVVYVYIYIYVCVCVCVYIYIYICRGVPTIYMRCNMIKALAANERKEYNDLSFIHIFIGEFEGVPAKLELHDHVHQLLQGLAPSFPPSNELDLTASATQHFIPPQGNSPDMSTLKNKHKCAHSTPKTKQKFTPRT